MEMSVYMTLALFGGVVFFFGGFRDLKRRRLIQNTPTARIRSMAMGVVEVNGLIEARSTVFAPFSGRPCAYWQVEIAVRNGRRHSWSTVHRNSSGHPFFLHDETGTALVYPKGAECKMNFGVEETAHGLSIPDCYSSYMKENGLWMRHVARLSSMRFRERVLEAGERIYVLGTAVPRAQVLTVSEIQLEATGTEDFRAKPIRDRDREVVATIRQGSNEKTFLISQQSERSLTLQLGWTATAKLIGGPLLTLIGLGWWLTRLSSGALFH
jgi:E3 Ubiquitin ligase